MKRKIKIIALGDSASYFASSFFENKSGYSVTVFRETDSHSLNLLLNKFTLLTKKRQYDFVFVIAFLGGKTTEKLFNHLKGFEKLPFICLYTKPFNWEGKKRRELALELEKKINNTFFVHLGIDLNIFTTLKMLPPKIKSEDLFAPSNFLIYQIITNLITSFGETEKFT